MKRKKISQIMGELADRHIEDALYCGQRMFSSRWKKIAACVALVGISFFGVTGIAFAANDGFRKMVVTFFSDFSTEEKQQIRDGHGTVSMDETEVLVQFLHDFNELDWGNGVKATYGDNGFDYIVAEEDSKNIVAIVTCESETLKLLVKLKGEEIERGVLAWKVSSYQMITHDKADELLKSLMEKTQNAAVGEKDTEIRENWEDASEKNMILADRQHGKIYHALHKEKKNIITMTPKETAKWQSILGAYENDEAGWEGQDYNYIVLFDQVSYMISEGGYVVKEDEKKHTTSAFKMNRRDLKQIMKLYDRYKIKY